MPSPSLDQLQTQHLYEGVRFSSVVLDSPRCVSDLMNYAHDAERRSRSLSISRHQG